MKVTRHTVDITHASSGQLATITDTFQRIHTVLENKIFIQQNLSVMSTNRNMTIAIKLEELYGTSDS